MTDFVEEDFKALRRAKLYMNDSLYAIELRAFLAQKALRADLLARVPCYGPYLEQQRKNNGLNTDYGDIPAHLLGAYGLYPPGAP